MFDVPSLLVSQFSSFRGSLSLLWRLVSLFHLKFHILSLAESETCCRNHQPHRQPATGSHQFPFWVSFIFLHCTKIQVILHKGYSHTLQVYWTYSREPTTKLINKDWLWPNLFIIVYYMPWFPTFNIFFAKMLHIFQLPSVCTFWSLNVLQKVKQPCLFMSFIGINEL